jgi:molybdopterin converting factor small subunit
MVNITVKLFATLREGRAKVLEHRYNAQAKASDLLAQLHINPDDVAILLINGQDSPFDKILEDGDVVAIFPPVGGG